MQRKSAVRKPRKAPLSKASAERLEDQPVLMAANGFIVGNYPFGCLGNTPHKQKVGGRELWVVPIVLTSPGYGIVGECGFVALEARTLEVQGHTPKEEVAAAVSRLRETKRDELEAAFHKARTA